MIKIPIKELESKLKYKIRKNFKSIGFDTAKRTGVAFIETNSKTVNIDWMFIEFKDAGNKKEIYKTMVNTFENILTNQDMAIVEQVFVGFNRNGALELARYGSFVIASCIRKKIPYELVSAMSARGKFKIDARKLGKGKSKESVALWLREKLDITLDDHDIADGFVLALIGICDGMDFKNE